MTNRSVFDPKRLKTGHPPERERQGIEIQALIRNRRRRLAKLARLARRKTRRAR